MEELFTQLLLKISRNWVPILHCAFEKSSAILICLYAPTAPHKLFLITDLCSERLTETIRKFCI